MSKRKSSGSGRSSPSLVPGRRKFSVTPALGTRIPSFRPPPMVHEEGWRKRAQALVESLQAVLDGKGEPADTARVERASAAWDLGNVPPKVAGRVAYLVERAHSALHEGRRPPTESDMQGGAHVLFNGLPTMVRNSTDFARVLLLIRSLAGESESWPAIVKATSELLGWNQIALTHASHALRVAMATRIERIG